jgi:hypothetical protein
MEDKIRPEPPYEANVTGTGLFPEELLRFDKCEFASKQDLKISLRRIAKRPRTLKVKKWSDRTGSPWHPGIWASQGWTLEPVRLKDEEGV